jgi:hypothetical protein
MKRWVVPLSFLGIFSIAVQAQDTPSPQAPTVRQACRADFKKFCSGVQPGGGRLLDCLNAHNGELTTACQESLRTAPAQPGAPKNSSTPDPANKPQ